MCDSDADGDTFVAQSFGGSDCDDTDDSIYPGAAETPYDNIDQDCNGSDLIPDTVPGTYYIDPVKGSDDPAFGGGSGVGAWQSLAFALERVNSGAAGDYELHLASGQHSISSGNADRQTRINQNVKIFGAKPL